MHSVPLTSQRRKPKGRVSTAFCPSLSSLFRPHSCCSRLCAAVCSLWNATFNRAVWRSWMSILHQHVPCTRVLAVHANKRDAAPWAFRHLAAPVTLRRLPSRVSFRRRVSLPLSILRRQQRVSQGTPVQGACVPFACVFFLMLIVRRLCVRALHT